MTELTLEEQIATYRRSIEKTKRMIARFDGWLEMKRYQMKYTEDQCAIRRSQLQREERELRSLEWQQETGHVPERHENCTRQYCSICEGGLTLCTRCGGLEGSLLPKCPGYQLTVEEHDANYRAYCEKLHDANYRAYREKLDD